MEFGKVFSKANVTESTLFCIIQERNPICVCAPEKKKVLYFITNVDRVESKFNMAFERLIMSNIR